MWKIFVPFSVVGNEGEKESMRGKGKALLKKGLPLPRAPIPHLQNFLIWGAGLRCFWGGSARALRRFPKNARGKHHSMSERAFTTGRMSAIRSVVSYLRD